MGYNHIDFANYGLREESIQGIETLTEEEFKNYYLSEDYETYFIEYFGDIATALKNIDYAHVYITQKFFSILFVKRGMLSALIESVPQIIGIQQNFIYTLSELVMKNDTSNAAAIYEESIPLDGEGVIVGIIGTGIDYLNPRFTTDTGESRIVAIWDQNINKRTLPSFFPYGTEYNKANITDAIKTAIIGGSPYDVVPHKDEVGHGTALAGIIGGRNLGDGDGLKSIAPKCEFAIVKLEGIRESTLELLGLDRNLKNVYQVSTIAAAINYLSDLQVQLKKPMVVYLPLGSNFGGRDGGTILERFIDNITDRRDFSVVTNTGNQGRGETHASGIIENTGDIKDVFITVGELQKSLALTIYIKRPDIISFSITSPLGNSTSKIPIPTLEEQNKYLVFEENGISIRYLAQERVTGSVNLNIIIYNTVERVWKITLFGDYIVNGLYDSYLLQSELLKEGTRFLEYDPNTTLLTPCTSSNISSTSCYNQLNNTVIETSGKGLPRSGKIEPVLTIGGVNILTTGINNSLILGTGSAMSGAILAGAVALIYQWGIVDGNLPELYPPRIRNLLISGTVRDDNKVYPNNEWGFGKLNFDALYEVLFRTNNGHDVRNYGSSTKSSNYLYINIPNEIYEGIDG